MAAQPDTRYVPLHDYGASDLGLRLQSGAQPQRLIMSLLGNYWRGGDREVPSAALVELVSQFGITTASARVALSRLARRGFLRLARSGRNTSYGLTEVAAEFLQEGGRQIFSFGTPSAPWDGRWRWVAFSVPEHERRLRHLLRARLRFAGYAPLYDGVWVTPRDRIAQAIRAIEDLDVPQATVFIGEVAGDVTGGGDPVSAWDVAALRGQFESYVRRFAPVLEQARAGRIEPADALVHHFYMVDEWLQISLEDPDLPDELLPARWPRDDARALFVELHDLIAPLGALFVREALVASAPSLVRFVSHQAVDELLAPLRGRTKDDISLDSRQRL